jgi:acetylornithine deacetylase
MKPLHAKAIQLLEKLIATPSFSKEETATADLIESFFKSEGVETFRMKNNVWVFNKNYKDEKPSLLLNSHHDTVQPSASWTKNPFVPLIEGNKLSGLGSNDAGGSLVSLIATFLHFHKAELPFNLVFAATAEEEISGKDGIEMILPHLGKIDCAIVGEPTKMNLAVAEKGLLVLDCISIGKTGHAAREEGENAIYKAMKDIQWFHTFQFPKTSGRLGKVKMSVTKIEAGTQHNVIPDRCSFTVDIRVTDSYSLEEIISIIKANVDCEIIPRSTRLKSSSIPENHPLVIAGKKTGRNLFGSPTLSDQALLPFPSVKTGPGDSARSHSADEFIYMNEIEEGIEIYIQLLEHFAIEIFNLKTLTTQQVRHPNS